MKWKTHVFNNGGSVGIFTFNTFIVAMISTTFGVIEEWKITRMKMKIYWFNKNEIETWAGLDTSLILIDLESSLASHRKTFEEELMMKQVSDAVYEKSHPFHWNSFM